MDIGKQFRTALYAIDSDLLLLSYDPQSELFPFEFTKWGKDFDVIVWQTRVLTPSEDAFYIGYLTKVTIVLKDETPVFDCPHVHYQMGANHLNCNGKEALQLYLQLLVNRTDGFVIWSIDGERLMWLKRFVYYTKRFRSPELWVTMLNTINKVSTMR